MAHDRDRGPARISDVIDALDAAFPVEWAEPWDRVGLLCGDAAEPVTGVLVSLDPTPDALARAAAAGANLLVTHHPVFLEPPRRLLAGAGAPGIVYAAVSQGVALACAHTNLDRAPAGAAALAAALDLPAGDPVERSLQTIAHLTVYVPAEAASDVRAVMAAAGAGRIGAYRGCSFSSAGTGRFVPGDGSEPYLGTAGVSSEAAEERIEAVCALAFVDRVVGRIRDVHPYEEPLIVITESRIARGRGRMGRVSNVPETDLGTLAGQVASRLGCVPRVWGDPERIVRRVATATGSAGSLLPDVYATGADVLIAGEVRYHDALDANARGLGVIEAGHDVTEWPLVPILAEAVRATFDLDSSAVRVDGPERRWWTP